MEQRLAWENYAHSQRSAQSQPLVKVKGAALRRLPSPPSFALARPMQRLFRISETGLRAPQNGAKPRQSGDMGVNMRHDASRRLFNYWTELRGTRAAPERASVDPVAIAGILGDTFILEVDPKLDFPFRVCGARANALFDRNLKGASFVELWKAEDRRAVRALALTALDGACPVVAGAMAAVPDRAPVEMELLLLPLRHNGKTHARLLGALSPARYPSWFGLLPAENLSLSSMRILRPEPVTPHQMQPARAFAKNISSPLERRRRFTVLEGGGSREQSSA